MIACDAWNRTRTQADLSQTSCELFVYQCLKSPSRSKLVCVRVYRLEAALCEGGRQAVDLVEVVIN